MKRIFLTAAAGIIAAGAAFADSHEAGDAAEGEKDFKKCKACHTIVDPEGNVIFKGGKTGPNLWGVIGRQAGTVEGFRYGASLVAAGEAGLVWDIEQLTAYVADPKGFLRSYLDDNTAKSKMTFKLKEGLDVATFLAGLTPPPAE
ncbi:MAG: cytochrome C [Rhodobacteraceae bacterium]|nr:cytochrome C [Paracoccaceae bacterium]